MKSSLFASFSLWEKALFLLSALLFVGCTPKIGDGCVLSTDCSQQGDRLCDTSEPGGYCTVFNCTSNQCPDEAACVMFEAAVPGCAYTDRGIPRTGRPFCVIQCSSDSDCRAGYVCADPRQPPWNGVILDDDQNQTACLVAASFPPADAGADASAEVCEPSGPTYSIDAAAPPTLDAGAVESDAAAEAGATGDAGVDAGADSGVDGGLDAGADASDSGM